MDESGNAALAQSRPLICALIFSFPPQLYLPAANTAKGQKCRLRIGKSESRGSDSDVLKTWQL